MGRSFGCAFVLWASVFLNIAPLQLKDLRAGLRQSGWEIVRTDPSDKIAHTPASQKRARWGPRCWATINWPSGPRLIACLRLIPLGCGPAFLAFSHLELESLKQQLPLKHCRGPSHPNDRKTDARWGPRSFDSYSVAVLRRTSLRMTLYARGSVCAGLNGLLHPC